MVLSFVILLIIYFFTFTEEFNGNKDYKLFKGLIFVFSFILLQALRVYGQAFFPDIPEYHNVFNSIKPIDFVWINGYGLEHYEESDEFGGIFAVSIEIGFLLLISIFKLFSVNFELFLLLISTFQLYVFYIFCKKLRINVVAGLMAYTGLIFITFHLGMIRQSIAFCFFLIGLMNIDRKLLFIFIILLGTAFHRSILICLFMLFSNVFINRKLVYFLSIFSLILYIWQIDLITELLNRVLLVDGFQLGKVGFYANVDRSNNYLGIGFWERLTLLVLTNMAYSDLSKRNLVTSKMNLLFNVGLFIIIFQLVYFASPTITSRFRYYFALFPVLFILEYTYLLKDLILKRMTIFTIFVYLQFQLYFLGTYLQVGNS